jgi:hypothetical protein
MNMRQMVTAIISEVHQYQHSVKHADGWHGNPLVGGFVSVASEA